jgi:aspartate/methionine/tyrosine aminotransferase
LSANLAALASYPFSRGLPELRAAMCEWIARRHGSIGSTRTSR